MEVKETRDRISLQSGESDEKIKRIETKGQKLNTEIQDWKTFQGENGKEEKVKKERTSTSDDVHFPQMVLFWSYFLQLNPFRYEKIFT